MTTIRVETDSLGQVEVPADKLWGTQKQRSLEHFSDVAVGFGGAGGYLVTTAAQAKGPGRQCTQRRSK